jgi:type I restriction enzyme S subunit
MSQVKLGKVLIEQRIAVDKKDGNKLPLIGVSNKVGLIPSQQQRLPDLSRYKLVKLNWLAYNPMRINVGSIGLADCSEKTGIISPDYVVFSCGEKILPEYFLYFIKSDIGMLEIAKNTGGSVRERLYFKNLANIDIELPSVETQYEILASLNKLKYSIEQISKICNELRSNDILELRHAIFHQAVFGKLTQRDADSEAARKLLKSINDEKKEFISLYEGKKERRLPQIAEDEIPFELPSGWLWCRLGEICLKIGSGSTPKGGREVYKSSGVKFIRSQNVHNDGLVFDNVVYIDEATHRKMEGTHVLPYDILLNITGGSIGRCALVPSNFEQANVNQHVTIIRTVSLINKQYIHNMILSPYFQDYIMATQTGGNREGLAKKNMELMLIPLPSLAEQNRIVRKIDSLLQMVNILEQEVDSSKVEAQRLLQAILNRFFASPRSGLAIIRHNNTELEESEIVTSK